MPSVQSITRPITVNADALRTNDRLVSTGETVAQTPTRSGQTKMSVRFTLSGVSRTIIIDRLTKMIIRR